MTEEQKPYKPEPYRRPEGDVSTHGYHGRLEPKSDDRRGGRPMKGGKPGDDRRDGKRGDRSFDDRRRPERDARPGKPTGERSGAGRDDRRKGGFGDKPARGGRDFDRKGGHGERSFGDKPARGNRDERGGSRNRDDRRDDRRGGKPGFERRGERSFEGPTGAPRKKIPPKGSPSKATPARLQAHKIIEDVRMRKLSVQDSSRFHLGPKVRINEEDRAFASLLATGVVSTRGCLDIIIDTVLTNHDDVTPDVRSALQLSTYEIIYLEKAPHAAVDQGVELVRAVAPRATKLANFVLRRIYESKAQFPNLTENPMTNLALLGGFPTWMVEALAKERGVEWVKAFLGHSGEHPQLEAAAPIYVTFNTNRVDPEKAVEVLGARGIELLKVEGGLAETGSYQLANRTKVSDKLFASLVEEGAIVISDLSAQLIAGLAVPAEKPASFLEIGAGRGTKTLMLQSIAKARFGACMDMQSIELDQEKCSVLRKRAERANVPTEVRQADACDLSSLGDALFDAVFIDAPCTGVGTMRRHPEIKWRVSYKDAKRIGKGNLRMLVEAAKHVAPGGLLTYATCTVFTEEDEDVVNTFLEHVELGKEFELVQTADGPAMSLNEPKTAGPDVHFYAQLRRK